jgi:hypothetical protein
LQSSEGVEAPPDEKAEVCRGRPNALTTLVRSAMSGECEGSDANDEVVARPRLRGLRGPGRRDRAPPVRLGSGRPTGALGVSLMG